MNSPKPTGSAYLFTGGLCNEGVKRDSVGLLFKDDVPRMEWFWELNDDSGHAGVVRWAIHSFELGHPIGIAVVDKTISVGDQVEVYSHLYLL